MTLITAIIVSKEQKLALAMHSPFRNIRLIYYNRRERAKRASAQKYHVFSFLNYNYHK